MKLRPSYVLAIACLIAVLTLGEVKSVQAIDGIALDLGTAAGDTDVERYGITIKSDWNAQWFAEGDWYLGGYWELGASYWDEDKGRTGNGSLGDFHVTPVLRLQRKPGMTISPFFEFGLGAHVHTDDSIGNKNFDIPFAFGSHVGGGLRFGSQAQYELIYRFQHLSNAGLGDDNPGINFHVLNLGYRF
jgi:lipid A 3-O-deacylase